MLKLGLYEHYKENKYRVIAVAKHSEGLEDVVIYQALGEQKQIWARPLSIFMEEVNIDGKILPRFKYINE